MRSTLGGIVLGALVQSTFVLAKTSANTVTSTSSASPSTSSTAACATATCAASGTIASSSLGNKLVAFTSGLQVASATACGTLCTQAEGCTFIRFSTSLGRCELWTQSLSANGFAASTLSDYQYYEVACFPGCTSTQSSSSSALFTSSSTSSSSSSSAALSSSISTSSSSSSKSSSTTTSTTSTASVKSTPSVAATAGNGTCSYYGCYTEAPKVRTLKSLQYINYQSMTPDICAAYCTGYKYIGVEYSGECYCGNELQPGSAKAPETECNRPCSGNPGQICGAGNRLNVYSCGGTYAVHVPSVPGYNWAGCYNETLTPGTRALNSASLVNYTTMTVEMCASFCGPTYDIFGLEYSGECYCGNAFQPGSAPVDTSQCGKACSGNVLEYCGDSDRLDVYTRAPSTAASSTISTVPSSTLSTSTITASSSTTSTTSSSSSSSSSSTTSTASSALSTLTSSSNLLSSTTTSSTPASTSTSSTSSTSTSTSTSITSTSSSISSTSISSSDAPTSTSSSLVSTSTSPSDSSSSSSSSSTSNSLSSTSSTSSTSLTTSSSSSTSSTSSAVLSTTTASSLASSDVITSTSTSSVATSSSSAATCTPTPVVDATQQAKDDAALAFLYSHNNLTSMLSSFPMYQLLNSTITGDVLLPISTALQNWVPCTTYNVSTQLQTCKSIANPMNFATCIIFYTNPYTLAGPFANRAQIPASSLVKVVNNHKFDATGVNGEPVSTSMSLIELLDHVTKGGHYNACDFKNMQYYYSEVKTLMC